MSARLSRRQAEERLAARYVEQCERFPLLARDVSAECYLAANWRLVAKRGLLAEYAGSRS